MCVSKTTPVCTSGVISTNGTTFTVTFSEAVTSGFGTGNFAMTMSGGTTPLSYVSGSGTNTWVFTLHRTTLNGETGTFAYTPGYLKDLYGNPLGGFSGFTVTNNSTQTFGISVDPVGYYPFDGNLNDSSGNDKDLTNNSANYTNQGKFGSGSFGANALQNGGGLLSNQDLINQNAGSGTYSISFWVYRNGTEAATTSVRFYKTSAFYDSLAITFNNASGVVTADWRVNFTSQETIVSGALISDTWHHIALVVDGGTATLYVDGSSVDSSSSLPTDDTLDTGYEIYFTGSPAYLDDAAIIDGVLTADDITYLNSDGGQPIL